MSTSLKTNTNAKVLIMAGGTGGHIFPALTIAQDLIATGAQVEWLGTRNGLEAKVIGATDIPLHFISISGLRGKGIKKLLLAPFAILRAIIQAVRTIMRIKPGCVLGMGGFVTGPGGIAAKLLGLKLVIHEQNAIAGMSNQLLFPFANVVMEAFPGAFMRKQALSGNKLLGKFLREDKIQVVGNPVRQEILALPAAQQRFEGRSGPLRILVIGGSLGAVAINKVLPQMLVNIEEHLRPIVKHQCGAKNLDETLALYAAVGLQTNEQLEILPFIEDMAAAYAWADLLICRSGASTIAEIAVAGLPSILVPYPWAVDDHQTANAAVLEQAGAAWILKQSTLNADVLLTIVKPMLVERNLILKCSRAASSVAIRDASNKAASICLGACYA